MRIYDYTEIENLLKRPLPINMSRKNVGTGRTQVFGFCNRMSYYPWYVRNNKKYPLLYSELLRLGTSICPFPFDAIQVNQNMTCKPHVDKGNLGLSLIVSGGNYTGGELVINGTAYDTKYSPFIFNGAENIHWNNPITSGEKWSVVFFKIAVPPLFLSKYPSDVNDPERQYSLIDYYSDKPPPITDSRYSVQKKDLKKIT